MKKINVILAIGLAFSVSTLNAQSLKEKMQAKLDKANAKLESTSKGKAKYTTYDYKDATGISGTYFTSVELVGRHQTTGFNYSKEENGEIVNKLKVDFGKIQGAPNSMTFRLKEKYKTKFDINYFYTTNVDVQGVSVNQHWRLIQIAENTYAMTKDASPEVVSVLAKDSANFNDYDLETAQVLFDQQMGKINAAAMEKETAVWMKNALYAKNVGKIVFATEDYHLQKRGYGNKPPMVNGKGFTNQLDLVGNMNYMAFFKVPPSKMYPGQDINIEFEMGGKKTSRTVYRKKSAAWGKMIPRIETSDFKYRQHAPRSLRTYNQYHSQWVQDYAFIQLLYMNKDKFMIGQKYNLTVKMYSSRDGENGKLIAEGIVSLLYSDKAHLAFTGDPAKPDKTPIWTQFEEFLDE